MCTTLNIPFQGDTLSQRSEVQLTRADLVYAITGITKHLECKVYWLLLLLGDTQAKGINCGGRDVPGGQA